MSAVIAYDEVVRLDVELVRLCRGGAAMRLRVGEACEAFAASGGHHEFGFSSFEAYGRERCERPARWVADSRAVARGVAKLPRIRQALQVGEINWSMAELLARSVVAETELEWLERARSSTVRDMRALLRQQGAVLDVKAADEEAPERLLTVTVAREDGWLFECVRRVIDQIDGKTTADALLQSLLAEGLSTLLESIPETHQGEVHELQAIEDTVESERKAQGAWCAQRERWRTAAEALCRGSLPALEATLQSDEVVLPQSLEALDQELRRLCSELAERDLELGIVAERAHRAEVWLRLGFASEAHYARERLGVSLSSLKAKRALAARAARLPELVTALSRGVLGYEAACLLSRVATPTTVEAWLERARERTVKHLREDVEAVELFVRYGYGREPWPPDEAIMQELFELERRVASGELCEGTDGSQISGGPPEKFATVSRRPVRSERSLGCVTYRWHVSSDTYRFWRALERVFVRVRSVIGAARVSFLRFLCDNLCSIWLPAIRQRRLTNGGAEPAYFRIYQRDAFRCTSPVCTRRDVSPHHLKFRSAGGGEEDENLTTLCIWCHLRGIHEGRIAAAPPASRISWRIGRNATLRVEGRTRVWNSFR